MVEPSFRGRLEGGRREREREGERGMPIPNLKSNTLDRGEGSWTYQNLQLFRVLVALHIDFMSALNRSWLLEVSSKPTLAGRFYCKPFPCLQQVGLG